MKFLGPLAKWIGLALIVFASVTPADEQKSEISQVWGRIIKVDKKQAFHGHRYFIYYVKDKKEYAYPIEIQNSQQEKLINAHVNKLAKISGSVYSAKMETDGPPTTFVYFVPKNVSPLSLSQLGTSTPPNQLEKIPGELGATNYVEGGISIPDNVANVAVFTAGALLVGSILKDYVHKK